MNVIVGRMNTFKLNILKNLPALVIGFVVAALLTTLVIYLTPLKHLNLVPPTMHEVDPVAFYKEYTAHPDRYIFVDVRVPSQYTAAHPKGAINIPIAELSDPAVRAQLPKSGKQIVLTCSDGKLAAIAYGYLQNWGYLNLLHLTGGLQQWAIDGLPVEGTSVSAATSTTGKNHSLAFVPSRVCPG